MNERNCNDHRIWVCDCIIKKINDYDRLKKTEDKIKDMLDYFYNAPTATLFPRERIIDILKDLKK